MMSDRDELADLIEDTIGTGYTGRVVEAAADAILARWRLVPVEDDVKFYPDANEDPLVMVDEHAHEWWSDFHGNVECVHCGQLMPNP